MGLPRRPSTEARRATGLRRVRMWVALRLQRRRRRGRNAEAPVGLAAPGEADWKLERQGNYAMASFLGREPEPFTNWNGQFRAIGDPAWLDAGGDSLSAPLAQLFEPWAQGGVEARVQYTDDGGVPKSDWSVPKQLEE